MNTLKKIFALAFALLANAPQARAQAGLQDMLYTVATTTTDVSGRHWAYLVSDATTPALLQGRQFAIYKKSGDSRSPALYERVAIVQRQTDPRVISALLKRSVNLGENTDQLNDGITKLFQTMTNALPQPLAEKISAVIRGAAGNAAFEANLRMLAKAHPALAMSLGLGHAELIQTNTLPLGNKFTFEIREFNPVKGQDVGVVGRVTVAAGQPPGLPAPGAPVRLPELNARGHLNAKLRWATPDDLRRLSLLNFGFNVWRMPRAFSESQGLGTNAPATSVLLALHQNHPNEVKQVNHVAVLKSQDFDTISVANFTASGDTNTFFFADDNDAFNGGTPFKDGEEFYYYVTARDLLGRDGAVSGGTLVMLCSLLPPYAPTGVQVENDYSYTGRSKQVLRVTWNQPQNSPPGYTNSLPANIVAYHVYRWTNQVEMQAKESNPSLNRIAIVPYVAGTNLGGFTDDGTNSPNMLNDVGRTFWYTVRAQDGGVCAQNLSPHSGMVYGVLRDRVGPLPPTGGIEINCASPFVTDHQDAFSLNETNLDPAVGYFRLRCQRSHPQLSWADFKVRVNPVPEIQPTAVDYDLGRVDFNEQTGEATADYSLLRTLTNRPVTVTVSCRVGVSDDLISPWVDYTYGVDGWPEPALRRGISFEGRISVNKTSIENPRPMRLSPPIFRQTLVNFFTLLGTPGTTSGQARIQVSTDLVHWSDLATNSVVNYSGQLGVFGPYFVLQDSSVLTGQRRFYRAIPISYTISIPCKHFPYPGNNLDATNTDIIVTVDPTPTTRAYKIYRRIDDGPLTLFAQGTNDYNLNQTIKRRDEALPAGASQVCYFAQLFDEHGNPSALTPLGDCTTLIRPPPCPSLSAIEPTTAANGQKQMIIRWSCPTNGVERFKFYLAPEQGAAKPSPSAALSPNLVGKDGNPAKQVQLINTDVADGTADRYVAILGAHLTGPIGSEIGSGPQFSLTLDVDEGREYFVKIKSVGPGGKETPQCNPVRQFKWSQPPPSSPFPQVQWPARPLPTVTTPDLFSVQLMPVSRAHNAAPVTNLAGLDPVYPVGLRIGTTKYADVSGSDEIYHLTNAIPTTKDPMSFLYPYPSAPQTVLPAVLYRTQMPSAAFPVVSGDVVQCSPLMEKIAFRHEVTVGAPGDVAAIKDPFIRVLYSFFDYGSGDRELLVTSDIYFLDTQPVLAGATYHYMLVRFKPNGEIDQTISAGNVTIPSN